MVILGWWAFSYGRGTYMIVQIFFKGLRSGTDTFHMGEVPLYRFERANAPRKFRADPAWSTIAIDEAVAIAPTGVPHLQENAPP